MDTTEASDNLFDLAPSQNVQDPVKVQQPSSPASTLRQMPAPQLQQAAPQVANALPDYTQEQWNAAAQTIAEQNRQALISSFSVYSKQDPDRYAEVKQIASTMGVDPEVADRNLDVMREYMRQRSAHLETLDKTAPVLASNLRDPEFMRIAHDQIQELGAWERVTMQWESGALTNERGLLGEKMRQGTATEADIQRLQQVNERMAQLPQTSRNVFESASKVLGQMADQAPGAIVVGTVTGTIAAGVGALTGPGAAGAVPLGFWQGFTWGSTLAMGAGTFGIESGNAYLDMLDQGISPEAAKQPAASVGLRNMVLELVGMGVVAKPFVGAAKAIGGVTKAALRPTLGKALGKTGLAYAEGILAETGTEVLQEVSNIYGEDYARQLQATIDGVAAPESQWITDPAGTAKRLGEIARETAMAMSVLAFPGPAINLYAQKRAVDKANHDVKVWSDITKLGENIKLKERDPAAWQKMVQESAAQVGATEVFVKGEQFRQVLTEAQQKRAEEVATERSIPVEQALAELPSIETQLAEIDPEIAAQVATIASGAEDVVIPTEKFEAKLAGTDLGRALLPHIRMSKEALSATEAKEQLAKSQQEFENLTSQAPEKLAKDEAFRTSARKVEDLYYEQLMNTGKYTSEEARLQAQFTAFIYSQRAINDNVTPEEAWYDMPLTVEKGADPVEVTKAVLAQRRPRMQEMQQSVMRIKEARDAGADAETLARLQQEHDLLVQKMAPVIPYVIVPKPATAAEAIGALDAGKRVLYGTPSQVLKTGDRVGTRLDIPAYETSNVWVVAVHQPRQSMTAGGAGARIGYESVARLTDVTFSIAERAAERIAMGERKGTIATMEGAWVETTPDEAKMLADEAMSSGDWRQVGMDPERHSYFYDRSTGEPIVEAEEVIQIGPLVFARNATTAPRSQFFYSPDISEEMQDAEEEEMTVSLTPDKLAELKAGPAAFFAKYYKPELSKAQDAPAGDLEVNTADQSNENKNGVWNILRVVSPQPDTMHKGKSKLLQDTKNDNAAQQLKVVDEVLRDHPNPEESAEAWAKMQADAFGTLDVAAPPFALIRDLKGGRILDKLRMLTAGQISDAQHGFDNAQEFRKMYLAGEVSVQTTAKLFLWSFLSRGVSPYNQESLFIDSFDGAEPWIEMAANGQFDKKTVEAYWKWSKQVALKGSGVPGAAAQHNLNAFGQYFLTVMGRKDPATGKTNLQRFHDMMAEGKMTGPEIRREFQTFAKGCGIDNKVVSFTLLVAGFTDVMVLDRVQVRQLWDDGRYENYNLYDGIKAPHWSNSKQKVVNQKIGGSSLEVITMGVRGVMIYEAIERAIASRVKNLYTELGRPEDASIGRYHWETWVADSQQEASHGTLGAILADARGDDNAIAQVTAKQGKYNAYEYGTMYGRDATGPYFVYTVPNGNTYRFTVPQFRRFLTEVKKPKNGIVPSDFRVSEVVGKPWFEYDGIDQQNIERLAAEIHSGPADGSSRETAAKDAAGKKQAPAARSARGGNAQATRAGVEPKAQRRQRQAVAQRKEAQDEILLNLSAATQTIPGLAKLAREANEGRLDSQLLLQEVAGDNLRYLLEGTSAEVEMDLVTGLYGGDLEPSLRVAVRFSESERDPVLAAVAQFAINFNQEQVHVRTPTARGKVGRTYKDNSFNTPVTMFMLKEPMSRADIETVARDSGLFGFTAHPTYLEVYFVGDPNDNEQLERFIQSTERAESILGDRVGKTESDIQKISAYGQGFGATAGYSAIRGDVRVPSTDRAVRTAQRIASRLAGREVLGTQQAEEITSQQAGLQARIAVAYQEMKVNNLDDPNVRRAYTELAAEVTDQYDALPIRVEIFDGKGEPYPGKQMSEAMRRDVLQNNHLYIYATSPSTFGPEGVVYDNHPLLADSGRKDINGKPMLVNDLLRAVHDYYAHTITAVGFGPKGEEAAWRTHMEMTRSPWARWALTSETRGQNSWVNFRPEIAGKPLSERPFAEQKVDLLPVQFVATGLPVDESLAELPGASDALDFDASGAATEKSQTLRQEERGAFDPKRLIAMLYRTADLSTYLHETSHFYLHTLMLRASGPNANARDVADAQALLAWFKGIDPSLEAASPAEFLQLSIDQQRQFHEAFSYNFEIYLSEGKAPSTALQAMFDKFAAWLKQIYKSLIRDKLNYEYRKEFGQDLPILTGPVRQVMDRMLASDEQIKHAEAVRGAKASFLTREQFAGTDEEYAAIQEMMREATDEAISKLTEASLRNMRWLTTSRERLTAEYKKRIDEIRAGVRDEVAQEVMQQRVYKAAEWLRTGLAVDQDTGEIDATQDHRLDLQYLEERTIKSADGTVFTTEQIRNKLGVGRGGMLGRTKIVHPDVIAVQLGYTDGVEMLEDLMDAKDMDQVIDERTQQRMEEEHGELVSEEQVRKAIDQALHNEARARFVAADLRALASATEPVRIILAGARAAAKTILGNTRLKDIRPRTHSLAELRANKMATAALSRGKTAEAIDAKRTELLEHEKFREAEAIREELRDALEMFSKFFGDPEKIAKSRDYNLVLVGKILLSLRGVGPKSFTLQDAADAAKHIQTMAPELWETVEPMIREAESDQLKLTDLKVDDFRALRDIVKGLWSHARQLRENKIENQRVKLDQIVGELNSRMEEIGIPAEIPGRKKAFDKHGVSMLLDAKAATRRTESWCDAMDGMEPNGPFTRYIWQPIKEALNAYRGMRNKLVKRYIQLVDGLKLSQAPIEAKEIGYTFKNKAELLAALLHTGNASNLSKLLLAVERPWGTQNEDGTLNDTAWKSFVARCEADGTITEADWKFVQAVWDLNEEIKPQTQQAHYELMGFPYKEVPAAPVYTKWGVLRGGYVPAKTDPNMVRDAQIKAKLDTVGESVFATLPHTGMGFTKTRVERYTHALHLDLHLMARHIDETIRFAFVQPRVAEVTRILRNDKFASSLGLLDSKVIEQMLIPWLNRAARQTTTVAGISPLVDKFWTAVRQRTGLGIMFANWRNAMQQVTGLFLSATKVKWRYLGAAFTEYLRNPAQAARAIASNSQFMADRLDNQMFDMQQQLDDLIENPNRFQKLQAWSKKHAYFLQSAFQNMVDVVTWRGAMNQAIAEGMTEVEARKAADAAVRLTQGSLLPEDIAKFEAGTPFTKTLTQFNTYFNMMANLNVTEFTKIIRGLGWKDGAPQLMTVFLLAYLLPTVVSDALVQMSRGGWDDDDDDGYLDEVGIWFFGCQWRAGMAMIPGVGSVANAAVGAFTKQTYDDRMMSGPAIKSLEASARGLRNVIMLDVEGRKIRDVLTLVAMATGIPVTVLGTPAEYLTTSK